MLKYAGLLVFGCILLVSLYYSFTYAQLIFIVIVSVSVFLSSNKLKLVTESHNTVRAFLILFFIGGAIRLIWAIFIPTLPVSDFKYYHMSAIDLSQNISTLTKNAGYTFLLSLGYRIYPHVQTGKIINAFASTFSLFLIFFIGSKLASPSTGLIAVFLFAILPSEINMVSVLGTEVVATTFILLVVFFLLHGFKSFPTLKSVLVLCCAGLLYGFSLIIRYSVIFYLPLIIILFLSFSIWTIIERIRLATVFLIGLILGLSITVLSYSSVIERISIAQIFTQDSFPFLSGTNSKYSGQWNLDDADLYYSWPSDDRDRMARQTALERITANPVKFLKLIPRKFAIFWGQNNYGNMWSLRAIDWGNGNLEGNRSTGNDNWGKYKNIKDELININGLLSQAIYVAILLFGFSAFCKKKISLIPIIAPSLVIFTFLPHIILEVQPRYHHYILPFMILVAANFLSDPS